jgi:lysophospholipase L1-like esterase
MSTVVFLGDSITLGIRTGVSATDIFSYKIGNARGFSTIINSGVANDTAAGGLARLSTDVLAHNPQCCAIMFGTNDVYNSVSVASYKASMKSIVQTLKANDIEPVIFSPPLGRSTPQIEPFPPYLIALAEIGYEENISVVDMYYRFCHFYFYYSAINFDGLYMDWAHPSPNGHQAITDIFLEEANNNILVAQEI